MFIQGLVIFSVLLVGGHSTPTYYSTNFGSSDLATDLMPPRVDAPFLWRTEKVAPEDDGDADEDDDDDSNMNRQPNLKFLILEISHEVPISSNNNNGQTNSGVSFNKNDDTLSDQRQLNNNEEESDSTTITPESSTSGIREKRNKRPIRYRNKSKSNRLRQLSY